MIPRDFANVRCHRVQSIIEPEPDVFEEHEDYFGNRIYSFAIESVHRKLVVTIHSEVTVCNDEIPALNAPLSWQDVIRHVATFSDARWFDVQEFCFDSPRIRRDDAFASYARVSFTDGRPIVEAALDLTERIHRDFKYDTTATNVDTSTHDAFRLKAGVCQDFSHVQIACLRSIGLPARYVSGYLRTLPPPGKTKMIGADESHAWASVYAGNEIGWIDLDPTNACITNANHIPICIGRDYSEVSPMRGVVLGGGKTQLTVSVDVKALDETPSN